MKLHDLWKPIPPKPAQPAKDHPLPASNLPGLLSPSSRPPSLIPRSRPSPPSHRNHQRTVANINQSSKSKHAEASSSRANRVGSG